MRFDSMASYFECNSVARKLQIKSVRRELIRRVEVSLKLLLDLNWFARSLPSDYAIIISNSAAKYQNHDSFDDTEPKIYRVAFQKLAKDRQTLQSFFCYASFIKISFYDHITNDTNSWLRVFWTRPGPGEHRARRNQPENSSLVVALLRNFNKWTFLYRPGPEIRDRNLQQEISYRILKLFMFSNLNKIS